MTQKKLSGAASIKRLKRALLDTKMANELFVDQIAEGAVTAEYAAQAFKNYAEWLASQHDALPTKERFVVGFVFSKNPERGWATVHPTGSPQSSHRPRPLPDLREFRPW